MNIQNNTSPSFGIRYTAPERWNKSILATMKKSKLAKDIDEVFPQAKASYHFFGTDTVCNKIILLDLGDDRLFKISAGRRRCYRPFHTPPGMNAQLKEKINNLSMKDVFLAMAKNNRSLERKARACSQAAEFNKSTKLTIKNPEVWDSDVLERFIDSTFASRLNKSFPNSKISYKAEKVNDYETQAAIIIKNGRGEKCTFSVQDVEPAGKLINQVTTTKMSELEKCFEINAQEQEAKRSPIVKFIRKILIPKE